MQLKCTSLHQLAPNSIAYIHMHILCIINEFACSGDHTVKVICVRTGKCLQTLTGHRRTPWVVSQHQQNHHISHDILCPCGTSWLLSLTSTCYCVREQIQCLHTRTLCSFWSQVRFHPSSSSLLASGSLDYEVRLWNAHTAECINVHNFGRGYTAVQATHSISNKC